MSAAGGDLGLLHHLGAKIDLYPEGDEAKTLEVWSEGDSDIFISVVGGVGDHQWEVDIKLTQLEARTIVRMLLLHIDRAEGAL